LNTSALAENPSKDITKRTAEIPKYEPIYYYFYFYYSIFYLFIFWFSEDLTKHLLLYIVS